MKLERDILDKTLKACVSVFYYSLMFSFVTNVLMLALPLYSLQVLDRVVSSGSVETLMMLSILVCIAFVCLGLLQTVRSFGLTRMGEWLDDKLSPQLLEHSISHSLVKQTPTGSQDLRDLSVVKWFLTGPTLNSLLDIPWAIIFIIVLYIIHPVHGSIALIGGGLLFIMAIWNEYSTKKFVDRSSEYFVRSMNQVEIATRNAEVVQAMGMSDNIIKQWQEISREGQKLQNIASNRTSIISNLSKMLRMMMQMLIIGAGGYLALSNEITMGAIIAGSMLLGRALAPFESSISSWKSVLNARKSYQRLQKSLTTMVLREETISLPDPKGKLSIEKVYYTPIGAKKPVLKGVEFKLESGDVLGIIGPSAAGKSTLAKLVASVWKPNSGAVRLDGADVFAWNRDEFGRHIGYVPQDVELFNGSVKLNIARMDPDAKDEDIIEAAQLAGVHELILSLPNGYETELGLGGAAISAGQRQRIALARTFYRLPKLIVLDEPNSNLDQQGDLGLVGALRRAQQKGMIVLIVSHRPSILAVANKMLVLNDGMTALFGPREEVVKKLNGPLHGGEVQTMPQQQKKK